MDVQRNRKSIYLRRMRRAAVVVACTALLSALTVVLARREPAALSIDRNVVWTGKVERGPMLRQVRGSGVLVPESVRLIPAAADGQVERILVQPGSAVTPSTIIVELSNAELQLSALEAELKVKAAEANFTRIEIQLKSDLLQQEAGVARTHAEYQIAKLKADTDQGLASKGLIAPLNQRLSQATAEELANRHRIEQERLQFARQSMDAQLATVRAEVDQQRAMLAMRRTQVAGLQVRAGIAGILQATTVEVGQRVTAGTLLGRVAEPSRLKAEIKVPETQAKDLALGQKTLVDTRNGVVAGIVARVDPAAREGTVTVDVTLEGGLPAGARPDSHVDGLIEIERLDDVLYINRPVNVQPNALAVVFVLVRDGTAAVRKEVEFGRSSATTIEVVAGLEPGDEVILSDTSQWASHDKIRFD
jgi:HlyD family secretion protein